MGTKGRGRSRVGSVGVARAIFLVPGVYHRNGTFAGEGADRRIPPIGLLAGIPGVE